MIRGNLPFVMGDRKKRAGSHTPVQWNKSLSFRLTYITVLTTLLLGTVMMLTLGYAYRGQLQRMYVERGSSVAKIAAGLIDGEMIDGYLGSPEKDEAYDSVMRRLNTRRIEHGVQYLYIIKPVEGGAVFVWDTDPENPVELGEFDEWDASYDVVAGGLLRGERVEPVTLDVKWGGGAADTENLLPKLPAGDELAVLERSVQAERSRSVYLRRPARPGAIGGDDMRRRFGGVVLKDRRMTGGLIYIRISGIPLRHSPPRAL